MALAQSNPAQGEPASLGDLGNAQIFIQNDGRYVQFFLQAGVYALPALGSPYIHAEDVAHNTFGIVPVAFVKIAPDDTWSVEAGKLPSLIGNESTFTFENFDIARGLLWNQTSSVSRGIQVNYAHGPLGASLSWNDGYYSGRYNWVTGLMSYALNKEEMLTLSGGSNIGRTKGSSFATPLAQNNSAIADLAYTVSSGAWSMSPYFQVSRVSPDSALGFRSGASTFGAALLASYRLNERWAIAGRAEYLASQGGLNLLYGPGSAAWSLTLTPTYQKGVFFTRMEAAYVGLEDVAPDSGFGRSLDGRSQIRLMAETGVLF